MLTVLKTVRMLEASRYSDLSDELGDIPGSTIRKYCTRDAALARLIEKRDGTYEVTGLGEDALKIDRDAALEAV